MTADSSSAVSCFLVERLNNWNRYMVIVYNFYLLIIQYSTKLLINYEKSLTHREKVVNYK